jgi:regulator of protease activity HflC (stomatin/prohibitin superfamily)
MKKNNQWFILTVLTTILVLVFLIVFSVLTFSVKIPVWYTGIKVNLYWSNKWVNVNTLSTGRNWYNPFTSDVYKYPTFIQQKEYSQVSFQDTDWLSISSNIWMDYQFKSESISSIFENYRASASRITDELMATWLKSSINRASSKFKVDELYWPKKEEFRLLVLENIKKDFDDKGIIVSNIYFVGTMDLPPQVMTRINAKIEATQTAMQKENELRAVEAEAQKQIAEAKWYNESQIIKAKADAEAIRIKSQAIMSQGWQEYVQLQAIEKWNGVLPVTTLGNNVPFVNLK